MCSLCPNQNPQKETVLVALTKEEVKAILNGAFTCLSSASRKATNSALEKIQVAYKKILT